MDVGANGRIFFFAPGKQEKMGLMIIMFHTCISILFLVYYMIIIFIILIKIYHLYLFEYIFVYF